MTNTYNENDSMEVKTLEEMIKCEFCKYEYADEFNFGHCPNGCHDFLPNEEYEE